MVPRLDFSKLCALHQHIVKAFKQIECPQSYIHGWSGLAMAPSVYALLEPQAFVVPADPGPNPVYVLFAPPNTVKMSNATFKRNKNYFLSYKNINQACFCMLDELVPNQYKVSNTQELIGWNASMSIQDILNQMEGSYGKPSSKLLCITNTLFNSPFAASDAPELLFYRIEQCQEVMTLGNLPYTSEQIIQNALRLLMASNIFPVREFDTWENSLVKTYPALKTFIHVVYTHCLNLMELRNMAAVLGYTVPTNNMNHLFEGDVNDGNSAMDNTTATNVAAAITGSILGTGTAASNIHPGLIEAINQSITPAFNQMVQNQSILLQNQIATMFLMQPPPSPGRAAGATCCIPYATAISAAHAAATVPASGVVWACPARPIPGWKGWTRRPWTWTWW